MHLDAVEHNDEIVFMHSVKSGAANQSYGLQVAKLAGIPHQVLETARQKLAVLEAQNTQSQPVAVSEPVMQMALFDQQPGEVEDYLKKLDINDTTPRQAMEHLFAMAAMLPKS